MSDNPPVSPPSYKTDNAYYWDFVTFLLEDILFRVPKYNFLAQSETFASQYGVSKDASSTPSSVPISDYTPVNLVKLDVTISDFRAFLKVLYPMIPCPKFEAEESSKNVAPIQVEPALSETEWLSVLKLSTRWRFNELRAMAIEALTSKCKMDHVTKANLANVYYVEQWLLSAYTDIVQRPNPITIEEAERLGWQNAITLFQIREVKITNPKWGAVVKNKILELFSDDFERIRKAQSQYMTATESNSSYSKEETRVDENVSGAEPTTKESSTKTSVFAVSAKGGFSFAPDPPPPFSSFFSMPTEQPKNAFGGTSSFFASSPVPTTPTTPVRSGSVFGNSHT